LVDKYGNSQVISIHLSFPDNGKPSAMRGHKAMGLLCADCQAAGENPTGWLCFKGGADTTKPENNRKITFNASSFADGTGRLVAGMLRPVGSQSANKIRWGFACGPLTTGTGGQKEIMIDNRLINFTHAFTVAAWLIFRGDGES
jgi:hypothetical protein